MDTDGHGFLNRKGTQRTQWLLPLRLDRGEGLGEVSKTFQPLILAN